MSASGQRQTWRPDCIVSAYPLEADIRHASQWLESRGIWRINGRGDRVARRRIGRRGMLAGATGLLISPAVVRAQGPSGVALVIGNSKYKWEASLPNVRRDAPDIAKRFQAFGLKTELVQDVGLDAMRQAIGAFAASARGANLAALYFAGHGATWGADTYPRAYRRGLEHAKRRSEPRVDPVHSVGADGAGPPFAHLRCLSQQPGRWLASGRAGAVGVDQPEGPECRRSCEPRHACPVLDRSRPYRPRWPSRREQSVRVVVSAPVRRSERSSGVAGQTSTRSADSDPGAAGLVGPQ